MISLFICPQKNKQSCYHSAPPPPRGLSGVPFCLFPGAAGLPLTSRREDLLSRGPLDSRLSPLSSLSCEPMLSWCLGLSVALAAPRSCSIPLEMLRGALSTALEAERREKKNVEHYICKPWKSSKKQRVDIQALLIYTCTGHFWFFSFF